jgi:hypothetical protein
MATTDIYTVMGDITNTRHAIRFLGGNVDDGVQIDAAAVACVAGNHTKGTITAWVMIPDYTPANELCIFGAGDADAAEYLYFCVTTGRNLKFMVRDGGATRVDVVTTTATLTPHKWHHVAVVQNGEVPKIYLDGVDCALTLTTATELSQWFDDTDGIDGAHIGAADSIAGDAALTLEFKGYISDFHLYSGTAAGAALSASEVIQDMTGQSVQATYLQNSYTMDGHVTDTGTGADNGTIVGALIYCEANEFTSRLSFGMGTPLVADYPTIAINQSTGMALLVQAA